MNIKIGKYKINSKNLITGAIIGAVIIIHDIVIDLLGIYVLTHPIITNNNALEDLIGGALLFHDFILIGLGIIASYWLYTNGKHKKKK